MIAVRLPIDMEEVLLASCALLLFLLPRLPPQENEWVLETAAASPK